MAPRRERPERPAVGDPNDPRGFENLFARYVEWLEVHHYSALTIKRARSVVGRFFLWCGERGLAQPAEVTPPILERYQRYLYHYRMGNGRPLSFSTQAVSLASLKSFFRWLVKQRYLLFNPTSEIELPRTGRRLPVDALSVSEMEAVLRQPETETAHGLRDRAILETFYSTGMRRMELVGLDLYDLDRERGWVTIRHGKGDKDRVIPIGERALAWVERYLDDVRPSQVVGMEERALFLSGYGERLTPDGMTSRVKRYLTAAGIERWGACHLFRHTCATLMLEGGADVRYVQEMLGHTKLETTQLYTQVSIVKLKEIHTVAHPARLERTSEVAGEMAGPAQAEREDEAEPTAEDVMAALEAEAEAEDGRPPTR